MKHVVRRGVVRRQVPEDRVSEAVEIGACSSRHASGLGTWVQNLRRARLGRADSVGVAIKRLLDGGPEGGVPCLVESELLLVFQGWHSLEHASTRLGQRAVFCRYTDVVRPAFRLTQREFRVSYLVGHGLPMNEIGVALTVSLAAARGALGRALQKLHFRGSTQLPAFWRGLGQSGTRFVLHGRLEFIVFECNLEPFANCDRLTAAERAVLRLILDGESNRGIAERRGTSVRTIANQLAVIFRKFGVASRDELAAKAVGLIPSTGKMSDQNDHDK